MEEQKAKNSQDTPEEQDQGWGLLYQIPRFIILIITVRIIQKVQGWRQT